MMPTLKELFGGLLFIVGVVGSLVATPAFGHAATIYPPWPDNQACGVLTAGLLVIVWLIVNFYFMRYRSNYEKRTLWLNRLVCIGVFFGALYVLILFPFLTFPDDAGKRHAAGLVYISDWKTATAPLKVGEDSRHDKVRPMIDPSRPWQEILRDEVNYDATQIWQSWSIRVVEVGLLLFWLLASGSLVGAAAIAVTGLVLSKSEKTKGGATTP